MSWGDVITRSQFGTRHHCPSRKLAASLARLKLFLTTAPPLGEVVAVHSSAPRKARSLATRALLLLAASGVGASAQRLRLQIGDLLCARANSGSTIFLPALSHLSTSEARTIRRTECSLDLPANYEISFYLRADAPTNHFQVKLVDASGENVWWFNRPNYEFPREWQRVTIKKRQIDFAWGPTKERTLTHAARLEFVVAAGRGGGAGSIEIGRLTIRERPVDPTTWPTPLVQASSSLAGGEPAMAVDGRLATAWKSDPGDGPEQLLTLDFSRAREFGGLMVRWEPHAYASRYDVQFSDDGRLWRDRLDTVVPGAVARLQYRAGGRLSRHRHWARRRDR